MVASSYLQSSFSGGEWSKTAQGRYDLPAYKMALARCLNSFPTETGAWTRRPGTIDTGHTKGGLQAKLLKFDFAGSAPYTLEFTANALRYRAGDSLVFDSSATVSAISAAVTTVITTSAAHGWSTGNQVMLFDLGAQVPLLHGRQFAITVLTATTFSLYDPITADVVTAAGIDYVAPSTLPTVKRIKETTTVYGSTDFTGIQSIQADKKAILLSAGAPYVLEALTEPTADTPATFSLDKAFFTDGPYLDPVIGGTLASPSAKTGLIDITLSFNAYVATTAYKKGDYVTSSSVAYVSLQDANVNHTPASSATYWAVTTPDDAINSGQGVLGTDVGRLVRLFSEPALWAVGTAYVVTNVVSYNGTYWTALGSSTGKIPGNDTTNWTLTPGNAAVWSWGRITALLSIIDRALAGSVNIGDMTSGGGLAAAFDGLIDQASTACAYHSASSASNVNGVLFTDYVGKNYSGASAQAISSATLWPSSNLGLAQALITYAFSPFPTTGWDGTAVVNLRAKSTVPASSSDGTLLGSTVVSSLASVAPISVPSNDTTTTWNYVWLEIAVTTNGTTSDYTATCSIFAAEAQFFGAGGAANGFTMELLGTDLLYTSAIRTWRLGVYSNTTGYPRCGTWHEGRLWLSGVVNNRIDSSKSNYPFDFSPTGVSGAVADDNAIAYVFNAPDVSPIYWMEPDRQGIAVGTQKGEWLVQATAANLPLTPTTTQAHRDTKTGAANVPPARAENSLLYVQSKMRKLMEYFADAYSGKFTAPNLAVAAKHLTKGGIAQIAYQQELLPCLWARTALGTLIGTTYKRDTMTTAAGPALNGWHRHELGSGRLIEGLTVGPSLTGEADSLYLQTTDTFEATSVSAGVATGVRRVELLAPLSEEDDDLGADWLLDGAVVPTTFAPETLANQGGVRLYGLWHLRGESVSVLASGLDCGDFTVLDNGTVFIPYGDGVAGGSGSGLFTADLAASAVFSVGFTFTSQGQLLRPHIPTGQSPVGGFAEKNRSVQSGIQLVRSQGMSIGTNFASAKMKPLKIQKPNGKAYTALELYSGIIRDTIIDDPSYDSQLAWQVTRPTPLTVVAIGGFPTGQTS